MTLRAIWRGLTSWLRALGEADNPVADLLGSHEERLIALEGEVRRMHAELRRNPDKERPDG